MKLLDGVGGEVSWWVEYFGLVGGLFWISWSLGYLGLVVDRIFSISWSLGYFRSVGHWDILGLSVSHWDICGISCQWNS